MAYCHDAGITRAAGGTYETFAANRIFGTGFVPSNARHTLTTLVARKIFAALHIYPTRIPNSITITAVSSGIAPQVFAAILLGC